LAALPLLAACSKAAGDPATKTIPGPAVDAAPPIVTDDSCTPLAVDLPDVMTAGDDPPIPDLENPGGGPDPLSRFYEKVARLMRGKATDHVRIGVYGDSNGTMDFMTGEMRRVLQTKYGDAGHGFVAVGRPWNWYRHRWVRHDLQVGEWESNAVTTKPTQDTLTGIGYYGHAMITAQSLQGGAMVWIGTADADAGAPISTRVARFEIYYLKWPRGGPFEAKIDGETRASVDTQADTPGAGFERIEVPDGPHTLTLVAKRSDRPVRFFGVTLTRDPGQADVKPSFQVDGLGVGSLNCLTMTRDDPATNTPTLQRRGYDLVVFHTGSNTFFGDLPACMKKVIDRHKGALPEASYLVMTPPDSKESEHIDLTCADLKRSAAENGAAFFDFRAAMGGDGSMATFSKKDMCGDGLHFNEKGGAYMGDRVLYALWKGLAAYAKAHPRVGCDAR
jgi:hypothetical protein